MRVELKGKSLRGVFALARNQGCIGFHCLRKYAGENVWRLIVTLPPH